MKDNQLDEHIRAAADRGEIPFDPKHFEQFKAMAASKRKRWWRRVLFWMFGAISLGLSVWFLFPFDEQNDMPIKASEVHETQQSKKPDTDLTKNTPVETQETGSPNSVISDEPLNNSIESGINTTYQELEVQPVSLNHVEKKTKSISENTSKTLPESTSETPQSKTSNTSRKQKRSFAPDAAANPSSQPSKTQQLPSTNPKVAEEPVVDPQTAEQVQGLEENPTGSRNMNSLASNEKPEERPVESPKITNEQQETPTGSQVNENVVTAENRSAGKATEEAKKVSDNKKEAAQEPKSTEKKESPTSSSTPKYWKLIAYTGPQFSNKNLSIASDQGKDFRSSNESQKTAIDLGIELDRELGKFNVKGGLNYYKVSENYSFPDRSDTTLMIDDNSFWDITDRSFYRYTDSVRSPVFGWVYTDSVLVPRFDSTLVEDIDTTQRVNIRPGANGKSSISYVSVPLLIGYEFDFKKLTLGVQSGLGISYLVASKGQTVNASGEINNLDRVYRLKQWNFNWLFSISADYWLFDRVFVGVQPSLRLPISSHSSDKKVDLNITNYAVRARVGIAF